MSTEDDLRRLGQTAAALAGVAAARAKQVAEQLLGPREKAREEAKHRAGSFVEEGRHAAADVVSALRREASVILRDLEHLEQNLRAREADDAGTATGTEQEGSDHLPAPPASPTKKAAKSSKAAHRKETSKPAKKAASTVKKAAPQAKKAGATKSATARKSTGGPGPSSSEGQG
jgi:hypothetical protein